MRKPLLLLSAVVVLFVGVILARTARYGSVPPSVEPAAEVAIPKRAAERLAGSHRFPPISSEDPAAFDAEPFRGLQADTPRCHPRECDRRF